MVTRNMNELNEICNGDDKVENRELLRQVPK